MSFQGACWAVGFPRVAACWAILRPLRALTVSSELTFTEGRAGEKPVVHADPTPGSKGQAHGQSEHLPETAPCPGAGAGGLAGGS